MSARRTMNLLAYTLALAWVVLARSFWSYGDLGTVQLFKLCAVPVGIVISCIVVNWLLDQHEYTRERGFEVRTHEKTPRI